ncbi:protein roadkill-like [Leguminivora glycinivorella]|uniref:protein roadkill-like n=1 Tax=Leguminivora glycinivorella TaxID=1035111 RepID=UPI00200F7832|nr:protein roadkill-like [Leguminivora glycinivorella]
MAPDPHSIKLLKTEHLGGTAYDFQFHIDKNNLDFFIREQVFDAHGLAQLKFSTKKINAYCKYLCLSVMKHEMAMMVNIEMTLHCENPRFNFTLNCDNTWSKDVQLFLIDDDDENEFITFNIEINIKVKKCKPVLDLIYLDDDFTDFQLSTAEGSVSVHKAILAAHSDVFRRMLSGEWKETSAGCIEIKGVTLKTLQSLKQYMYLGSLPEDDLRPLLLIATYYFIDDLKAECTLKIAHSITSENLYDLLEFSYVNNLPELTFAILRTVKAQPRDVIEVAYKRMMKPQKCEDLEGKNEKNCKEPKKEE